MKDNSLISGLILIIGGFFLGSILFCKIIPLIIKKRDICKISADHNPGAANVFVNCGVIMGMICLIFDMFKGYIPVYLGMKYIGTDKLIFAGIMAAPVLGHAIAPLNSFHGGKCIATSFGEVIALLKVTYVGLVLAGIYIFFSTIYKINPNRKRSIVTFGVFGVLSFVILTGKEMFYIGFGCFIISAITIIKHLKYFAIEEDVEYNSEADKILAE